MEIFAQVLRKRQPDPVWSRRRREGERCRDRETWVRAARYLLKVNEMNHLTPPKTARVGLVICLTDRHLAASPWKPPTPLFTHNPLLSARKATPREPQSSDAIRQHGVPGREQFSRNQEMAQEAETRGVYWFRSVSWIPNISSLQTILKGTRNGIGKWIEENHLGMQMGFVAASGFCRYPLYTLFI